MKSYYRRITVLLPKVYKKYVKSKLVALYLKNIMLVFLVIMAGILLQILANLFTRYEIAKKDLERKGNEYQYWKSIALQFPNIPDILYDAALSSYNANMRLEALDYVKRALEIDPLFKEAINLRKEILER